MGAKLLYPWLRGAYVYALKIDGVVRYIGKGRRYRLIEHRRIAREINRRRQRGEKVTARHFYNRLAKLIRDGINIEHVVIAHSLNDEMAFELEAAEIAVAPKGQLWNSTAGGAAGDPDYMRALWADPKHRARFSKAIREGKRKPEFRDKARRTAMEQWADPVRRARWEASHRAIWDSPERAAERKALLKRV